MSLKILLADDSMTAQNMGKKILVEAGFQVIAVSNGAVAMKKIASEKPDLLVLDVFMPGYSGLEICEKVKGAPSTASMPVILTVSKMEPFRPEEGNKVRADGVIVKPFEASDLVAAVQKLAARLTATPQKTLKMAAPAEEAPDASYEDWKSTSDELTEIVPPKIAVPQEMASAAAFDLPEEVPAPPATAASGEMPIQAPDPEWIANPELSAPISAWGSQAVTSALEESTSAPAWAQPSQPVEAPPAPGWSADLPGWASPPEEKTVLPDLAAQEAAPAHSLQPDPLLDSQGPASASGFDSAMNATVPGLETTSAGQTEDVAVAPAPGFEAGFGTAEAAHAEGKHTEHSAASTDPALLTDQTKMVSEFATRFGVENAEPVPVGVAEHMVEEAPASAAIAETPAAEAIAPAAVDAHENAATLAREMHEAFANVPPEPPSPEPAMEAASVAPVAAPAASGGDQELADALHAAISGAPVAPAEPMEPQAVEAFDPQMVARAIDRVLDRFKGELWAEIMRELKK